MTATFALICALLAATMSGAGYNPATAAPRGAPNDQRSEGRTLADAGEVSTLLGAPPVASSPAQLERLRVSTVGSGVGVRVESVPTDHLSGAPPLAAVTASESIAMPAGSFASPAAVTWQGVVNYAAPSLGRSGIASWFDARGYQGAVPWWRPGQDPVAAVVCRYADSRSRCVSILLTGFCQCLVGQPGERVVDLSRLAFAQLADPAVGLIRVTLEVPAQGARLPATDSEAVQ